MANTSSTRRLGGTGSKTRAKLLDAAEQLLLEEGSGAVTSRRVGARADLTPQLVHYYFRSMEDLFVEVFRRRAEESLAHAAQVIGAGATLRSLWQLNADLRGAAFNVEFVALANRHPAVRAEVARYAERFRSMQLEAVGHALARDGISAERVPPVAVLLLMTGLSQVLLLERALGVTTGHAETLAFVTRLIDELEPPDQPA
jgi:TetR/AcrR family transcriptional regulator